jgi:hypothetical protein
VTLRPPVIDLFQRAQGQRDQEQHSVAWCGSPRQTAKCAPSAVDSPVAWTDAPRDRDSIRKNAMVSAVVTSAKPRAIPVGEILPWAVFAGLLFLLALYFVGAEQGATSIFPGMYIHEFVHDGRHLLGFPCH